MVANRRSASSSPINASSNSRPKSRHGSRDGHAELRADPRHVRYALVGLGHIAQAAVLPGFEHARKNSRLLALVSDDAEKLTKIGRKHGIEGRFAYQQFDDLCASGEIDAVYIALPNHLHETYSVRAAEHGIHVLCEKPLAVTEEECRRIIEARDQAGIKFMTAYRLHFEKANMMAAEIANSGKLGDLRFFSSSFSLNVKRDNIRTEADCGGGPLHDIGIYCINAARYIFRQEPISVSATAATRPDDERFAEIDEMVSATMHFPDQRLATFLCSFGASPRASYDIVGTEGSLCVDNAYEYTETITHEMSVKGRESSKSFRKSDQFGPEIEYFSRCILNDEDPEPSAEEGLIDVRIIEALNRSIRQGGRIVELDGMPHDPVPTERQVRRMPGVKEPSLVKVESASEE